MRRYIKRYYYALYKSRRKLFLTTANKRRRITWSNSQLSWTPSHWERVLWTDELVYRFHMKMLVEKLQERGMKQMIDLIAIACFLIQAL